jgi:hypothetical protein
MLTLVALVAFQVSVTLSPALICADEEVKATDGVGVDGGAVEAELPEHAVKTSASSVASKARAGRTKRR